MALCILLGIALLHLATQALQCQPYESQPMPTFVNHLQYQPFQPDQSAHGAHKESYLWLSWNTTAPGRVSCQHAQRKISRAHPANEMLLDNGLDVVKLVLLEMVQDDWKRLEWLYWWVCRVFRCLLDGLLALGDECAPEVDDNVDSFHGPFRCFDDDVERLEIGTFWNEVVWIEVVCGFECLV